MGLHMRGDLHRTVRLSAVLLVALAATVLVLGGLSGAATRTSGGVDTLDRDLEPVIVTGDQVAALSGAPVDDLFVYAYVGSGWQQIPAQVDEVTASGAYTTSEDGLLDANDELVFMATDLGDQSPAGNPIIATLDVMMPWYEIEVGDPTSPGSRAWAYVVRSSTLTPTYAVDYVTYDQASRQVRAEGYTLGFTDTHPAFEYLALAGGGSDILDRSKIRARVKGIGTVLTEEDLGGVAEDLVKDGPVRVVLRDGKGFGYGSMLSWSITISPGLMLLVNQVRYSTDFTQMVSGSVAYNAVALGGVIVDGYPDIVPATPLSSWWQLSTGGGTVIQVGDTSGVGGVKTNYYLDDSTYDPADTGDRMSFGDVGVLVDTPGLGPLSYGFNLYILDGLQPNVGTTYESYFGQPLFVTALMQELPPRVYLPMVLAQ